MNAIKNVVNNNYRNMELDEFLKEELKDAGYGGVDIQKSPLGTRSDLICDKTWSCNWKERKWNQRPYIKIGNKIWFNKSPNFSSRIRNT